MKRLLTAEGETLPETPWEEYPRPHLRRSEWLCLNGQWTLRTGDEEQTILVPFCPESLLSGIAGSVRCGDELLYSRKFLLPPAWEGRRILLHFGAVSRTAEISVNGRTLFRHENSYLPFTVEITGAVTSGENELCVRAVNDLSHAWPWGKQKADRGGMWYTPVSGIWQTVWLEPVPDRYVRELTVISREDHVIVRTEGIKEGTIECEGAEYPLTDGEACIRPEKPEPWSPERPRLYRFTLRSGEDAVGSYFALRTLDVREAGGRKRLCLNGKPYFFHGLLDQGYWSDGLYTPASPECFEKDILAMKGLGFNTLRKHIKIEPELYYYACDRLGMAVFQDMVNVGDYSFLRDTILPTAGVLSRDDRRLHRDPEVREHFVQAMEETVERLSFHPCIVYWTIFNEGWGQFSSGEMYDRLRGMDDTRFIDSASGWFLPEKSDVESVHIYFRKLRMGASDKPQVLSEFGGYAWQIREHSFNTEKVYGYRKYKDRESFVRAVRALYKEQVLPLAERGLSAAIYTQVSDVEDETNGLLTFDRRIKKLAPEDLLDISRLLTGEGTQEEER